MSEAFEIAARAVCATEAADLSDEQRAAYVEANWRARHTGVAAGHAAFIAGQRR